MPEASLPASLSAVLPASVSALISTAPVASPGGIASLFNIPLGDILQGSTLYLGFIAFLAFWGATAFEIGYSSYFRIPEDMVLPSRIAITAAGILLLIFAIPIISIYKFIYVNYLLGFLAWQSRWGDLLFWFISLIIVSVSVWIFDTSAKVYGNLLAWRRKKYMSFSKNNKQWAIVKTYDKVTFAAQIQKKKKILTSKFILIGLDEKFSDFDEIKIIEIKGEKNWTATLKIIAQAFVSHLFFLKDKVTIA